MEIIFAFIGLLIIIVPWVLIFGGLGSYIGGICNQPKDRGFWHGLLLGPIGLLLLALYPRETKTRSEDGTKTEELLVAIRSRASMAAATKGKRDSSR